MRSTEKKLFVVLFTLAWLVAGALWLVLPSSQPSNAAEEPTVTANVTQLPTGTPTPTPAPDTYPTQIKLVVTQSNTIDVRIVLKEATTISGAELFFKLPNALTLVSSKCGGEFSCPRLAVRQDMLTVSALRPLRKTELPLRGEIVVATLVFDGLPTGSWFINTRYSEGSQIVGTRTSANLLTPYQTELTLLTQ